MTVEEARGELGLVTNIAAIKRMMITDLDAAQKLMDGRIDAYGDARELKGHVRVCGRYAASGEHGAPPALGPKCGDGWYCDQAKKLGGSHEHSG